MIAMKVKCALFEDKEIPENKCHLKEDPAVYLYNTWCQKCDYYRNTILGKLQSEPQGSTSIRKEPSRGVEEGKKPKTLSDKSKKKYKRAVPESPFLDGDPIDRIRYIMKFIKTNQKTRNCLEKMKSIIINLNSLNQADAHSRIVDVFCEELKDTPYFHILLNRGYIRKFFLLAQVELHGFNKLPSRLISDLREAFKLSAVEPRPFHWDRQARSALVWIHLNQPKGQIKKDIGDIIDNLHIDRNETRLRYDKYDLYLKVWGLKENSNRKIAKEIFPDEPPGDAKSKVKNLLKTAKHMIEEGGWINI
jgi:hypothetical protein